MVTRTRNVILFEECAKRLGKTPEQLISHIVQSQHFSNQGAVIGQNLARYHQTGYLPDYVVSYVTDVLYGEANVSGRTSGRRARLG